MANLCKSQSLAKSLTGQKRYLCYGSWHGGGLFYLVQWKQNCQTGFYVKKKEMHLFCTRVIYNVNRYIIFKNRGDKGPFEFCNIKIIVDVQ